MIWRVTRMEAIELLCVAAFQAALFARSETNDGTRESSTPTLSNFRDLLRFATAL